MSSFFKRGLALLPSIVALPMAMVVAPAVAPDMTGATASAQPCGYYSEAGEAYYNNCTNDGLIIRVGSSEGSFDTCAMPGITYLGTSPPIRSAYVVPHVPVCG